MDAQASFAGKDAVDFQQHAVGGDVEAAAEDEAAVVLQRDLDAGDGAELAAGRDGGEAGHLLVQLLALQRPINDVVAAGGETKLRMLCVLALADQKQRHRLDLRVAADLAAELGRGHVEQVDTEDDELWPLRERLEQ